MRASHQSMLHRIIMDVMQVMGKVFLIPDRMFPETLLSKPTVALLFHGFTLRDLSAVVP